MGQSRPHSTAPDRTGRSIRRPLLRSSLLVASGLMLATVATVAVTATATAATTYPTWTATTTPVGLSTNPSTDLEGLSCPSTGSCVAVGDYENGSGQFMGLIETEAQGSWTTEQAPMAGLVPPASFFSDSTVANLQGVSCTAVGNCVAVGYYNDNATPRQNEYGLIEVLAGGTWTALAAPTTGLSPAQGSSPADAALHSISCASAVSCVAGGSYTDSTGDVEGLIETLSGGTWTATAAPLGGLSPADVPSANGGVQLEGMSCPTAGSCVAVGYYMASGGRLGLIETLSGGTWTPTASPLTGLSPAAVVDEAGVLAGLAGVSCPAVGSCVAVGQYEDAAGTAPGLIETLSAGTWTASTAPAASVSPSTGVDLDAVVCPAAGSCLAVGGFTYSANTIEAAAATLAGGTWTAATVPTGALSDDPAPTLSGLSCPAVVGSCVAAGAYTDWSDHRQGLIETQSTTTTAPGTEGYWLAASDGGIFTFNAPFDGSMGGKPLDQPVVGMAEDPCTGGYWEVASDGGIFSFDAPFYGSMGGKPLDQPVVGIAAYQSATGCGYWEVASDGGIFSFNAPFLGSMGGKPLDKPVVGMAFDAATGGYWEVASDGGIFSFGAGFFGSMGGMPLDQPVVAMAADPATGGYWEVASDGGIFAFNAPFYGSTGGTPLDKPVVGMAADAFTGGYWEVASDGGIFSFNAPFQGSMGGKPLDKPVVGMAADA